MCYSKFTGNAQRRIRLKRAVRRTIHTHIYTYIIEKIAALTSMWGSLRLAPIKVSGGYSFWPFHTHTHTQERHTHTHTHTQKGPQCTWYAHTQQWGGNTGGWGIRCLAISYTHTCTTTHRPYVLSLLPLAN